MKYTGTLSRMAVCGIAAAAWIMAALPASAVMRVGEAVVTEVKGSASYSRSGANGPIEVGTKLQVGDTITTTASGSVGLDLGKNGNLLRVQPNSSLTLTKLDIISEDAAETELFLAKGRVGGNTKKVAGASKYEIKTPNSVAGIRGTEFAVSADGTVTVLSGTVIVIYVLPGGVPSAPVAVQANQSVTPPPAGSPAGTAPTPQASTAAQVAAAQSATINIPTAAVVVASTGGTTAQGGVVVVVVVPPPGTSTLGQSPGGLKLPGGI